MDIERLTAAARAAGYAMAASDDPLSLPLDCEAPDLVDPNVSGAEYRAQPSAVEDACLLAEDTGRVVPAWLNRPLLQRMAAYLQRLGGMPARAGSLALPKPMQHLPEMPREPKMALAFQQR